jgi:hypothetical protein
MTQARNEGFGLPMTERSLGPQSLAFEAASAQATVVAPLALLE